MSSSPSSAPVGRLRGAGWGPSGVLLGVACFFAALGCSSEPAEPLSPGTGGAGGTGGAASSSGSSSSDVATAASVSSTSSGMLPESFEVSGIVTDGVVPLEGAIVMQGGGAPDFVTGVDGTFTITITTAIPGTPAIVAAKTGYRAKGLELFEVPGPVVLELSFVSPPDNTGYTYGKPGVGDPALDTSTAFCGHCHTTFTAQFQTSAHARATKDPLVQDLYAGVAGALDAAACASAGGALRPGKKPGTADEVEGRCYLGAGVLPDLNPACAAGPVSCDDPALDPALAPTAFGSCADCHAAGLDGKLGGRDLLEATGVAFDNGNHCDVCHHVSDIDRSKPAGTAGRLVIHRPSDHLGDVGGQLRQVMFGPLPDVPNEFMGGSYQPKFSTAELCAGCHQHLQPALIPGDSLDPTRWPDGLPIHTTYDEWSESAYATAEVPCQHCHMPPDDTGLWSSLDVTTPENASLVFGFVRPPNQLRKHTFRGPLAGAPRLIDGAVALFLSASPQGGELVVSVGVQNFAAGHALPTGEPMRSLVLVLDGASCNGALAPASGATVEDVGGAVAEGVVGVDVTVQGSSLLWSGGALRAKPGDVVRFVRPTGVYDDYPAVGFFADPTLTPYDKGLELAAPVGSALVDGVGPGVVSLEQMPNLAAGDRVFLGEPAPPSFVDGDPSRALAGAPGRTFAKVLSDASGARLVPHHRAVDIRSDNRIPPGAVAWSDHGFALPAGCASATVHATLLYRPAPLGLSRERGWDGRDFVVAEASEVVALP